jgi:hypothetical protein
MRINEYSSTDTLPLFRRALGGGGTVSSTFCVCPCGSTGTGTGTVFSGTAPTTYATGGSSPSLEDLSTSRRESPSSSSSSSSTALADDDDGGRGGGGSGSPRAGGSYRDSLTADSSCTGTGSGSGTTTTTSSNSNSPYSPDAARILPIPKCNALSGGCGNNHKTKNKENVAIDLVEDSGDYSREEEAGGRNEPCALGNQFVQAGAGSGAAGGCRDCYEQKREGEVVDSLLDGYSTVPAVQEVDGGTDMSSGDYVLAPAVAPVVPAVAVQSSDKRDLQMEVCT